MAIIKGIFYNEKNLKKMKELMKNSNYFITKATLQDAIENGLETRYLDKTIYDWFEIIEKLAIEALDDEERKYLTPLKELLCERKTLKQILQED